MPLKEDNAEVPDEGIKLKLTPERVTNLREEMARTGKTARLNLVSWCRNQAR